MSRRLAMVLALAAGCACSGLAGSTAGRVTAHPAPTAAEVAAVALRADELRVASFGAGAVSGMAGTVGGPAAELFERNWMRFQRLHEHLDVIVLTRALVHWSAAAGVAIAVVATTGRQRLAATAGDTAWDNFADQWQYTVRWAGGWRVWAAVDLPPGQWWPA